MVRWFDNLRKFFNVNYMHVVIGIKNSTYSNKILNSKEPEPSVERKIKEI